MTLLTQISQFSNQTTSVIVGFFIGVAVSQVVIWLLMRMKK